MWHTADERGMGAAQGEIGPGAKNRVADWAGSAGRKQKAELLIMQGKGSGTQGWHGVNLWHACQNDLPPLN